MNKQPFKDLIAAIDNFVESSRNLWLAEHPDEAGAEGITPMSVTDAEAIHESHFFALRQATHYARKEMEKL